LAVGGAAFAGAGVADAGADGVGQGGGVGGEQEVAAVLEAQALGADVGAHDRGAHGQGLDDLEAGAAADAQGDDELAAAGEVGAHVGHAAGDLDVGSGEGAHLGQGVAADDLHAHAGWRVRRSGRHSRAKRRTASTFGP
jgi:hypothetical protein